MSYDGIPSISNRHCLMLGLGRYLIVFDPLTLVLDQWKHNWQMRSQQHVLNRSKNFTSCCQIRMPPIIPTVHYRDFKKPIECSGGPNSVFHADVFNTWACWEHFNFFKVNRMVHTHCTTKHSSANQIYAKFKQCIHPEGGPIALRRYQTTSILTATTLIYTIGAGITAAAGTRLALRSVFITDIK